MLLDWFASIVLTIFASIVIKDIDLWFSFLVVIFVWFGIKIDGGFIKCLREYSLLFSLLESFEQDQYKSQAM